MKKIALIAGVLVANFTFAQSVVKLQLPNDIAVIDFDMQNITWKKSKQEFVFLCEDSPRDNGYQYCFIEGDRGTFVFTDSKKLSKGFYIQGKSKKKVPFKKL